MVKLISKTEAFSNETKDNNFTSEDLIVYTARVSNPSNQLNKETAENLIKFLIKNKHWSPFEMVNLTFEIKTSRAIAQQILRHRSFSFQEFSQRYSTVTNICDIELRKQAQHNRQSSTQVVSDEDLKIMVNKQFNNSKKLYNTLLSEGIAREVARGVLPLNTETTMYMNGSIRSWLSYFNVRLEKNTQKEHREVASEIATIIGKEFPILFKATNEFNKMSGMFM